MARGRKQDPEQQEKTRTALLDATCQLLAYKSYKAISIRETILREFSIISSVGLFNLFTTLQDEGLMRKDMNIKFFVASFMSLIGFPIMTQPLLKTSLQIDLDTVASAEWKQHISELLRRCVA